MQTAASAGESLAAGVIFTFPALIIMSEDDDDSDLEGWGHFRYVETVVIAIAGGACVMCYSLIHSFTHSLIHSLPSHKCILIFTRYCGRSHGHHVLYPYSPRSHLGY